MVAFDVLEQISLLIGHVVAFVALEVERFRMREHVFGQIVAHGKSPIALFAKIVFLLRVHGHVDFEFALRPELPFAHLAREFVHRFVALFVYVQRRIGGEFFQTQRALEHFLDIFQMDTANVIGDDAFATEKCAANVALVVFDFLVEVVDVIAQSTVVGKRFVAVRTIRRALRFRQMILFAAAVIVRCGFVRSLCRLLRWRCIHCTLRIVCCTCGRRNGSSRCIIGGGLSCFFGSV